ncbi:MAG: threonine ammonia-lyase, biosynthetic [Pseudomonadota bacterium]
MNAADYISLIQGATVYDIAIKTPLDRAQKLSHRLGHRVWLKREDLQPVFSFKLRGAYNKISQLGPEDLEKGIICSSAGNHAQGVALAAGKVGARAVIVMPRTTPRIKVEAVKSLGGDVVLTGDSYDDAYQHAQLLVRHEGLYFVHPFDDPLVIAGQGTIGMEILEQLQTPSTVFIPIGGGGLAAGIALYVKNQSPDTKVIGVEPTDAASMQAALRAGGPVTLDHVGIFADGVAVKRVGEETFRLCQHYLDEIVTVDTDETCAAIRDVFEETRSIVEPAGALAVAGMKKYLASSQGGPEDVVAILCGANVNFDRLRHISERASVGEQQEALIAVEIPEQRGSFMSFCEAIGDRNVTEFNYRFNDREKARIFVGLELMDGVDDKNSLIEELRALEYPVVDLSNNEMAKLHVRHMVGGSGQGMQNERLHRFEFPERPGTLMKFLQTVGGEWNISLFHYRNHGADYGRVLTGVQVPDHELQEFHHHLDALGYVYYDESDNPAYQMFLA